jgi:DNA-binding beta-propeller fold protein YncE
MNDEPREKLAELVTRFGRSLIDDPRRAEGLLRDVCGEHRREVSVLVSALRERVAADLQASQSGQPKAILLGRLTKRLEDNLGLAPEPARWAVESWALALGVVSEAELRASRPAAPKPASSKAPTAPKGGSRASPTSTSKARTSTLKPGTGESKTIEDAKRLALAGQKIQAIQLYRQVTGSTLKRATEVVEAWISPAGGSKSVAARLISATPALGPDLQVGSGVVVTIAGTGQPGFADGPALSAQFKSPRGIAVDAQGTLYVADTGNKRIRRIKAGQVLTVAGIGGGWLDGWQDGPIATARFEAPTGIAVDPGGTIYVNEENGPVRRITSDMVYSVRPSNEHFKEWGLLDGLALAPDGTIYTADAGHRNCLYRIQPGVSHSTIGLPKSTFTSLAPHADGLADQALFWSPSGLAVDQAGSLYISDDHNQRIRKLSADGRRVTTVAGCGERGHVDGPPDKARFNFPKGLAVDSRGRLYIADIDNHLIRRIETDGTVVTIAGCGKAGLQDGPALSACFNKPRDLAIGPDGTIYVVEEANHSVRAIRPT